MSQQNCQGHEHHLCKLHADGLHQSDPSAYAHLVREPKYVCKSCGRVAAGKENLCMPAMLGTWEE